MVNRRVTWFLETNNVLRYEEAGFRPQRLTNQQVATLSQHINDALDARNTLTAPIMLYCCEIFSQFNTTYKMFIQPKMFYCCEPLITATEVLSNPSRRHTATEVTPKPLEKAQKATEVTLKPLEKAHNQARDGQNQEVTLKPLEKAHYQELRLITGGVKSTPRCNAPSYRKHHNMLLPCS
ncbi:unnamed protein product [Rodentolepis nana]|uniref:Reverse transcriptase domain-containing protein n=1 Tax=Rodentolepis nana TaxID=102285 RepID=A0A0R3TC38_RODNA|nr:unnamed protein product [Rodentolepis nana]